MIKFASYSEERDEFKNDDMVCFCFEYTKKDIEKDYIDNGGQSAILQKIAEEKKAGKCDCAHKNPKSR
ncbi:MAG: hypothetical protein HY879_07080 [Deltaproteobacteria bacterium]|nr:hypothetical protein [Deltaproteobacteria bacterium]